MGVRQYLTANNTFKVLGEASDGVTGLKLCQQYQPDLLVLDLNIPGLSGIEVLRQLTSQNATTKVLVLSAYDDAEYVAQLLQCGAVGYVFKGSLGSQLLDAATSVVRGENWLSPQIASRLFCRNQTQTNQSNAKEGLSRREIEILTLVATGLENDEIAERLCLSKNTIQNHVSTIYSKISVPTRSKAIIYAIKNGLVKLNEIDPTTMN
jgi:DNA-binding NarL/FixJ family response regulator